MVILGGEQQRTECDRYAESPDNLSGRNLPAIPFSAADPGHGSGSSIYWYNVGTKKMNTITCFILGNIITRIMHRLNGPFEIDGRDRLGAIFL